MKRSWLAYILTFVGMVCLVALARWLGIHVLGMVEMGPETTGLSVLVTLTLFALPGVHCVAMFAATPSWRRRSFYVTRVPWSLAQAVLFFVALVIGPQLAAAVVLAFGEGPSAEEHETSGVSAPETAAVAVQGDNQDTADGASANEASGNPAEDEKAPPNGAKNRFRVYARLAFLFVSAAIVAAVVVGMRSRGRQTWRAFGFGRAGLWRNVGIGVVAYLAFRWAILPVLGTAVAVVFDLLGESISEHEAIREYRETGSHLVRFAIMLTITFTAPVFEEIAFRGVLFQTIKRYAGAGVAIGLSALVFAMFHWDAYQAVNIFFLGLLFGYLFDKTGSIVPGIVLHFLFNVTTMIALMLMA